MLHLTRKETLGKVRRAKNSESERVRATSDHVLMSRVVVAGLQRQTLRSDRLHFVNKIFCNFQTEMQIQRIFSLSNRLLRRFLICLRVDSSNNEDLASSHHVKSQETANLAAF